MHNCPYCCELIDLGDWDPYAHAEREIECPSCHKIADIEWDTDNGWFAWLTRQAPTYLEVFNE